MVAYSVPIQSAGAVLSGAAVSVLRPGCKHQHAQAGDLVQVYLGVRMPDRMLLIEAPCVRSVPVWDMTRIVWDYSACLRVGEIAAVSAVSGGS
ncbi:hypothetical protein KL867_17650 [Ruegeria litorea]|uniref:Uncharacterized protein n=1 Tax=Falsiruegeria litorea TaxID=1280831 RepID=A0ABS5WUT1_9RHOB|nr:hypothetical protein [Falsiruegeria litorea]MBT3142897.1 hypothetical protein [Falsiruegeria litorea]